MAGVGEPGTVTAGALADGTSLPLGALLVQDAVARRTAARSGSRRRGGDIGPMVVDRCPTAPEPGYNAARTAPPLPSRGRASLAVPPTVSSLDRRDSAAASALLLAAYQDDPLLYSLVPDDRRRLRVAKWIMRPVMHEVMEQGLAIGAWADGVLVGIALWMPPGTYPTASRRRLTGAATTITLGRIAGLRARRITRSLATVDRAHPRSPHWYLWFLGVDIAHRGMGIGARLIEAGLARIDAEQEAAYAETFTERSASLFARAGFETAGALDLDPELAPGRTLWRPARIR